MRAEAPMFVCVCEEFEAAVVQRAELKTRLHETEIAPKTGTLLYKEALAFKQKLVGMEFDAVALLEKQLADLSGGGDGDTLHAELQETRRLVAERDEDIRSYEGHLNALEAERDKLRAALEASQGEAARLGSSLADGGAALAVLQLRAARAEADARRLPQLLSALARQTLEGEVLAGGIAEAEADTSGVARAMTEFSSNVVISQRNSGETASRAVHERVAAEKLLTEERQV